MSETISRATTLSRIAGLLAVVLIGVLVAAPWWGDIATERLIGEFMVYLALATLWNLLAGYTGLVSVGQQAYVGFGARHWRAYYCLWPVALAAGPRTHRHPRQ